MGLRRSDERRARPPPLLRRRICDLRRSERRPVVGGSFDTAGPHISANLARYAAPAARCAADLDDGSTNGVCATVPLPSTTSSFFLTAFEAGKYFAVDLDNGDISPGVHDGAVTIDDLLYFLVHFEEGC